MTDQQLKGVFNGACNRSACGAQPATWFNTSTRAYYCARCANMINRVATNAGEQRLCMEGQQ